jgi:glycosyltransferase involved in cell wall biosynthesis
MSKNEDDNPLVSIFISTYNRKESILNTLTRIYQQSYRPIEVIVVDNASSDGSYEEIRSKFKEVNCIRISPSNIGNIKAKNEACKHAQGKYLLSIDDDSFPGKYAIERMVEKFELNQEIGLITFNVYNEQAFIKHYEDERQLPLKQYQHEHYFWSGCGGGYRREIVEDYGYWEEWGRISPYELGISAKTMKMGLIGMNFSDIYVFHSFGSYMEDKNKSSNWGFPAGDSINYRVSDKTPTIDAARNSLLFIIKYYPINFKTLFWIIKYCWHASIYTVQSRKLFILKAFFDGVRMSSKILKERVPLSQIQAEKLPVSFNFKGK